MSNSGFMSIKPALTFRPLSPFLALLIAGACKRLEGPEELAPASLVHPRSIEPVAAAEPAARLDRMV